MSMIERVKQWLGIEGVKIEVEVPDEIAIHTGQLKGLLRLSSMSPQQVTHIRLALIERYGRGRGKDRLVDEHLLGELNIDGPFEVLPGEVMEIEFSLPFQHLASPADMWAQRSPLARPLIQLAKWVSKVEAHYRLEVEATVAGTALNPFVSIPVVLK